MLSIDMLYFLNSIFTFTYIHTDIYIYLHIHTYIHIFVHAHIYIYTVYIYLQKGTPQLPWQHVGDDQRKWKEPLHVSKRDYCESELWDQIAPALNMLCSSVLPGQVWWVSIIFMWCCIHPWCLLAHGWCKIAIRYPHFFFFEILFPPPYSLNGCACSRWMTGRGTTRCTLHLWRTEGVPSSSGWVKVRTQRLVKAGRVGSCLDSTWEMTNVNGKNPHMTLRTLSQQENAARASCGTWLHEHWIVVYIFMYIHVYT